MVFYYSSQLTKTPASPFSFPRGHQQSTVAPGDLLLGGPSEQVLDN